MFDILFIRPVATAPGQVAFVGAGPGSADDLTLGALRALHTADVIIHDRLIGSEVLALIPPHVVRIDVGKQGFGPSTPQAEINRLIVSQAVLGLRVLRLKAGDPGIFGRLDEEIAALEAADIPYTLTPGLTSAAAAAAAIGQSLTQRGRNASLRILTGHDMAGFADHDWRGLARPGEVAAIYMGKASARFMQGRLLMHGAAPGTPVAIVENASRPDQRIIAASLATLPEAVATTRGPAILLYGLAPRRAATPLTAQNLKEIHA